MYHESNQTLENRKYGTSEEYNLKHWNIPIEGQNGTIEEISTSKVLGLKDNSTKFGALVILEIKVNGSEYQLWSRSNTTTSGYFSLRNPISGRYLTAHSSGKLNIHSNNFQCTHG